MSAIILFWLGLAAALVYLAMSDDPPSWPRSVTKTIPLMAFAGAAAVAGGPVLLVAGLALSALGDLALSLRQDDADGRGNSAFLAGLSAFALAHLVYVLLFLSQSQMPLWLAFVSQPVLAFFVLFVALSVEIWLVPHVGGLRWPVRAYAAAIGAMGIAALTLPMGSAPLGALYFIASDVLLGLQYFRMHPEDPLRGRVGWFVWGFYIAGQVLILSGTTG